MTVAVVVAAVAVVLLGSLIKQVDWSDKAKQLLVSVLSVVGGFVTVWATGGLNGAVDVLETALLVYGSSQLIYAFIFGGTTPERALAEISFGGDNSSVSDDEVLDQGEPEIEDDSTRG